MTSGDSPTVARRRVRLALREARETAGLTQHEVAEEMEWSLSKVIRIENGDVSIAPNDLRPLLAFLGIRDRARIADLLATAKVARTRPRQAWYQTADVRGQLTDGLRRLIEYEAEALSIHSYSVFHVPGLLQIPEYSRALMETWRDELPDELRGSRLEVHRLRREAALARIGSMRTTALLDESVFMRTVGGAEVFAAQLREILRLEEQRFVSVRMFPFVADAALSYNASFDILFLGDEENRANAVLYRETGTSDEIVEYEAVTTRHYGRYEKLWEAALSEAETIAFIRKRISELEDSTNT
jgi:transcriptional regulator with XRE-family HTH domain